MGRRMRSDEAQSVLSVRAPRRLRPARVQYRQPSARERWRPEVGPRSLRAHESWPRPRLQGSNRRRGKRSRHGPRSKVSRGRPTRCSRSIARTRSEEPRTRWARSSTYDTPKRSARPMSLDLPGRALWDLVDHEDPPRDLEGGQGLRDEILKRRFTRIGPGLEHHGCGDLFAKPRRRAPRTSQLRLPPDGRVGVRRPRGARSSHRLG